MLENKRGIFIVLSGPSGVGKGTICKRIIEKFNSWYSVSMTTRGKRVNEVDGVDYFFVTKEQFEKGISDDDFLEYAVYNDNYYGTPKSIIDDKLNGKVDVVTEIEVNGAKRIKEIYQDSVLIYVLPPSLEELENRLRLRNTEDEVSIQKRMNITKQELKEIGFYDYVVVNDDLDKTVERVIGIIESERCKVVRNDIRL